MESERILLEGEKKRELERERETERMRKRREDERCSDWDARREMKLRQLRMAIHIQRREGEAKEDGKEKEGRKNQKLQVQDSGFLFSFPS